MRMKPKSTVHNPRALLYKRFTDLETSTAYGTLYRTTDGDVTKYWAFRGLEEGFVEVTEHIDNYHKIIDVKKEQLFTYANYFYQYTIRFMTYGWERHDLSEILPNGEEVEMKIFVLGGESGALYSFSAETNFPFFTKEPLEITISHTNPNGCYIGAHIFIDGVYYSYLSDNGQLVYVPANAEKTISLYSQTEEVGLKSVAVDGTVNTPNSYDDFFVTVKFKIRGIEVLSTLMGKSEIARYQTNKYYLAGSFDYMIRGSINSEDTQPLKGNIMHLHSFEIKHFDDRINIDHDDLVVIDGHLYGVENLAYDVKRSPKPYTVYFATLNNIK